jgi:putative membrane protein (TIGR04086 family)
LQGLGYALALTAVFVVIVTMLVSFTGITEAWARWIVVGGAMIAVLVGSSYTGRQIGKSGWLNGAITGTAFVVILLVLAMLLDLGLTSMSLITLAVGFGLGAVGGVLGINQ